MKEWTMLHFYAPMMEEDTGAGNGGGEPQEKPVTLDDHLKGNPDSQKELDRRITKALNTARENWEKEQAKKLEDEKTEAAKLAKMSAEQKAEHERQKREEEFAKRESALTMRELRAEASGTLAEKGLPLSLLDCLNFADAEKCNASIDTIEKAFRAAVQAGVEDRMKGSAPKEAHKTDGQMAAMRAAMGLK